jgi:hypothetical protein
VTNGKRGGGFVERDTGPDHDLDRPARGGVFDGVVDQVLDDLQDFIPVAVHGRDDVAVLDLNDDIAFDGQDTDRIDDVGRGAGQIDPAGRRDVFIQLDAAE